MSQQNEGRCDFCGGRCQSCGAPYQPVAERVNPPPVPEITKFDTGAVRDTGVAGSKPGAPDPRYDLITPVGLRRLAEIYEEGATKYAPRNWEKGIPVDNLMNHLMAHLNEWNSGDRSEDHLAKVAWGVFAIMHLEEKPARRAKSLRQEILEADSKIYMKTGKHASRLLMGQECKPAIFRECAEVALYMMAAGKWPSELEAYVVEQYIAIAGLKVEFVYGGIERWALLA